VSGGDVPVGPAKNHDQSDDYTEKESAHVSP